MILPETSAERGAYRGARVPWAGPFLDYCQRDHVELAVICSSAQVGKTTAILNAIGYYTHQEPCPVMIVLADELTAGFISKKRFQPMFRKSPTLAGLILEEEFGKQEMTLANGSYVVMAWASSVARLATREMRIVVFDEIDKPGYSVTSDEASAISLGTERTATYPNRKRFKVSTPTNETGNIWVALNACDVVFDWHARCPHCGVRQPLRWSAKYGGIEYRDEHGTMRPMGQVVWEGGLDATREQIAAARYECGSCKALWTTVEKNIAVERGALVPRQKIVYPPKSVGIHVNRITSLLG